MSAFKKLHPAIQHHIENSLGWPGLRPAQHAAIEPILGDRDCLLLPFAGGGETEAAVCFQLRLHDGEPHPLELGWRANH